jgi:hypothetical protein
MFRYESLSRKLICVLMGIGLGIGAVMIYLTYLMAMLPYASNPMVLIPIEVNQINRINK